MPVNPAVTLLIPTWNAGPEFPRVLARMLAQEVDRPFEVVVVDSGSTDGTVDVLRAHPVRLIEIPNTEFNHGLTRNLGVREAHGEIVVLATQDAYPDDLHWMQRLVDCFADPRVAGAYSRQIPRSDANPFIRDRLGQWAATATTARVQRLAGGAAELATLAPLERLARIAFDNVSASLRRAVALEIPFRQRQFGEDLDWAHRVLLAGYDVVYEPRSCVVHSHNHSMWYELKRVYLDHQNLHRLLGVHTIPRPGDLLRCTAGGSWRLAGVVARDPTLRLGARLGWWARVVPYSLSQNLAQFLGARSVKALEHGSVVYGGIDRLLRRGV
jgi:rhamnosyltransferase